MTFCPCAAAQLAEWMKENERLRDAAVVALRTSGNRLLRIIQLEAEVKRLTGLVDRERLRADHLVGGAA